MSAALVKKSLQLSETNCEKSKNNKKRNKTKARVTKVNKQHQIISNKKLSVEEARKSLKKREEILKNNLQVLKSAKEACKVKINKDTTEQILERARRRSQRYPKEVEVAREETAFTEEDFKKFEEEYFVD